MESPIVKQVDRFLLEVKFEYGVAREQVVAAYLERYPDDANAHYELLKIESSDIEFRSRSVFTSVAGSELSIEVLATLAGWQPLLDLAIDSKIAWYIRRRAISAMFELVDELPNEPGFWESLMTIVESECAFEVRSEALWAVVDAERVEFLPRVTVVHDNLGDDVFGGDWNLVLARAALGDQSCYVPMLELLFDPWSPQREKTKSILPRVLDRHGGVKAFSRLLAGKEIEDGQLLNFLVHQHENPCVRRWALSQTRDCSDSSVQKMIARFRDSDWGVREQARRNLISLTGPSVNQSLCDVAFSPTEPRLVRSWCLATLIGRGETLLGKIDFDRKDPVWRVPWDFEIEDSIRHQILVCHGCPEEETDVRYLIEASLLEDQYPEKESDSDRESLVAALQENGIPVSEVRSAGEYHAQGSGTYWVLRLGREENASEMFVSTIHKSVMFVRVWRNTTEHGSSKSWSYPDEIDGSSHDQICSQARAVAERLGFCCIDETLAGKVVPGFNIYFFGDREPLPIKDLLFYWQD